MTEHGEPGDRHHGHGHGHHADRGPRAMLRYLRWAPQMWRSVVNDAVIDLVAPAPGERVLDIGAGMGPGTVRAARAGATVVAVEPTPFMRGVLKLRRLPSRDRTRITVVDAAAERLPASDGSIDAVWAVNTMHHWLDTSRAAGEISRVLRPGGRVVLVDENFHDPSHPDYERFAGLGDHGHHDADDADDPHHAGDFTMVGADEIGELFRDAGLIDVDARDRRLAGRPVVAVTARAPG